SPHCLRVPSVWLANANSEVKAAAPRVPKIGLPVLTARYHLIRRVNVRGNIDQVQEYWRHVPPHGLGQVLQLHEDGFARTPAAHPTRFPAGTRWLRRGTTPAHDEALWGHGRSPPLEFFAGFCHCAADEHDDALAGDLTARLKSFSRRPLARERFDVARGFSTMKFHRLGELGLSLKGGEPEPVTDVVHQHSAQEVVEHLERKPRKEHAGEKAELFNGR